MKKDAALLNETIDTTVEVIGIIREQIVGTKQLIHMTEKRPDLDMILALAAYHKQLAGYYEELFHYEEVLRKLKIETI